MITETPDERIARVRKQYKHLKGRAKYEAMKANGDLATQRPGFGKDNFLPKQCWSDPKTIKRMQEAYEWTHNYGRKPMFQLLAEAEHQELTYLWPGWIACGVVTTFAGEGGCGKSYFTLKLASDLIARKQYPDGQPIEDPDQEFHFFVAAAEDHPGAIIRPRVHKIDGEDAVSEEHITTIQPGMFSVDDDDDMNQLARQIALQQADGRQCVLIIDPLSEFVDGERDLNKEADVRAVYARLSRLAEQFDIPVICIRHFNKRSEEGRGRVSGSHAFTDAARALIMAERVGDLSCLYREKMNYVSLEEQQTCFVFTLLDGQVEMDTTHTGKSIAEIKAARKDAEKAAKKAADDFHALNDILEALPGTVNQIKGRTPYGAKRVKELLDEAMKQGLIWCKEEKVHGRSRNVFEKLKKD